MGTPLRPDVRASVEWLRRFARTTPGIVGMVAIAVATLCVIAGVVSAAQLGGRLAERDAILTHSEPFAYAAQNLYAALSAADAAAASEFLSSNETGPMRERYQQALADASAALADATAGSADIETRTAVAEIAVQLAAYAGLVESARANNLQGFPIGSAYLREASSLMQSALLPGAERIHTRNLAEVDANQRVVGSTPTAGLVLLGLAVVSIVLGSVVVAARTNRQFNVGLVVAAVTVLAVVAWVVVATRLAAGDIEKSRTEGTEMFGQLAKARILAQQARTDETLQLIAHGDITAGEESFNGHLENLGVLLGTASSAAGEAVQGWADSHRRQVEAYQSGDYAGAVGLAIGPDPRGSAGQFTLVESSLRTEMERSRATLRDGVSAAGGWLAWSPTGTLVLMGFAAGAAVTGLWPRLKEFV
ncbi:hypothetical protein ACRCUN_12315 [Mycobacterium sp. LTG2003]